VYINPLKYLSHSNKSQIIIYGIALLILTFNSTLYAQIDFDQAKIGIAFSENTWKEIHSSDQNYYFIQAWELFLLDRKIAYSVFTDDELDNFDFEDMDILILPGVEYLSDDAVTNLKEFINSGKSVFIFGNIGTYKTTARKRLNNVCEDLIGLDPIELTSSTLSNPSIEIFSNNPFTYGFDSQDYNLPSGQEVFYIQKNSETTSLGNYGNEYSNGQLTSAISYGTVGSSRFVWMGFQISQIEDKIKPNSNFESLILNSLNFLCNKPLASINNFPASYQHAFIFINEVKDANRVIKKIKEYELSNNVMFDNFFTPEALEFNSISDLSDLGNMNLVYNPLDYLNNSNEEIDKIFQTAKTKIEKSNNKYDFGVYDVSPFESYLSTDPVKFDGYSFRIYDNSKIISANRVKLFSFKKLDNTPDAFAKIFSDEPVLVYSLINDFDQSSELADDQLKKLQIYLMQNNYWVTTFEELLDWYNSKNNISVTHEYSENNVELRIKNNNPTSTNSLSLNLILPAGFIAPTVSDPGAKILYDYETHQYWLEIEEIHAYQEIQIDISE
jgi:hypothetical protein